VITAIQQLLADDTAGDPMSTLKWTRRTTGKIAQELGHADIVVSRRTVGRLLHALHYSLRVNRKQLGTDSSPDRDGQFRYITAQRRRFERRGDPIISVDTKKRELVGLFKNPGAKWDRAPTLVNDHDFPSDSDGVAIPYGIYDVQANRGYLHVGVSHDTSAFAVEAIAAWWGKDGRGRYPTSRRLLILADTGGSNSCRYRAWKTEIQRRLCNRLGLTVTIAHYPTGASKWNPVEHRLFSEISKQWAAEPLTSYEKILKFIRTTATTTGLKVRAFLDRTEYPTKQRVTVAQMAAVALTRHKVLPKWNYTISPRSA
jgi:hypothetical protein